MSLLSHSKHLLRTSHAVARSQLQSRNPILPLLLSPQHSKMSSMASRLSGKTIVITGASSGIGKSCALEFAKTCPDSLKLVLTARRLDTLKEVAREIESVAKGVKVLPVRLDVSRPEEVKGFVEGLPEEFRGVDVLVNNAYVVSLHWMLDTIGCLSIHLYICLIGRVRDNWKWM
jgi:3-hydroxy acid dehydrogenase/malonic semialdehyde reductase